ncbi:MAG TPA: protein kinase [Blastocatellia bacterium]|nr:protein kinase [Blastocatellia bacterium]
MAASDRTCPQCKAPVRYREHELVGTTLADKYDIEEHLGSGGMCDVYRARHKYMGKEVAVKVLRPELAAHSKITERFEQEAKAASRISHPNAINVTDYGVAANNTPYIVMEFVKGETLGELIRRTGPLPVRRCASLLRQICGALDAAHSVGVIHRDIKPDNIIIATFDGGDWVEVVDFGVAKILEDVNRNTILTGANIIVGTPRYMSPEQCEEVPVDARSDIYSLGVVLYEMLAGEAPFAGSSSTRLLMAHASEPPPPLRQKRPDLSPELEAVVMSALEKDPSRRPQSAGDFARRFEEALGLDRSAAAVVEREGAFSRIKVPIGEEPPAGLEGAAVPLDEPTVVRARDRANVSDLRAEDDLPAGDDGLPGRPATYSTPARGTAYVATRDRSNTAALVIGVIALLAAAGIAAWTIFGDRLFGRSSEGELIEAQQAITDSIARVESLPKDHPLRTYLPQLLTWQGELRGYLQSQNFSPQAVEVAGKYRQRAEDLSGQARTALAQVERDQNVNMNSAASAPTPTPHAVVEPPVIPPIVTEEEATNSNANPKPDEQSNENSNTKKKERPEPPVTDPVKPSPEPKPSNSNRPRNDRPPDAEQINQDRIRQPAPRDGR